MTRKSKYSGGANREGGADAVSIAFDAGRVDAFDAALKILDGA